MRLALCLVAVCRQSLVFSSTWKSSISHYIAGTSMGALAGAFYASGTSASEIEQIALGTDWSDLLTANPRFVNQPVAEKKKWNKPSGSLVLRLGRYFSLSGLSAIKLRSAVATPRSEVLGFPHRFFSGSLGHIEQAGWDREPGASLRN